MAPPWRSLQLSDRMEEAKRWLRQMLGDNPTGADAATPYDQFQSRSDGGGLSTLSEKWTIRIGNRGVHCIAAAWIAGIIGLIITAVYCVVYSFFHGRGQGRSLFIDHLELVDLLFAFTVGIPCHFILFWGLRNESKPAFLPYLTFYATNFLLNVVFTLLTIIAALTDLHSSLMGSVQYDIGWTIFQIAFTAAQGYAIYVVLTCRRYFAAKQRWREQSQQNGPQDSAVADAVAP